MSQKNNLTLQKIIGFDLFQFLLRIALIAWIIFAAYKFYLNPIFFLITIIFALFLIASFSDTSVILKEKELEIKETCWLWIFNRSLVISLDDIENIEMENGKIDKISLILNLIAYIPGTIKKDDTLIITFKNKEIKEFKCIGSKRENRKLIESIKKLKK